MPMTAKCGLLLGLLSMGSVYSAGGDRLSAPPGKAAAIAIENFESGAVNLTSYPGEDQQPSGWSLDSLLTHNGSGYALRLTGNTWKVEAIPAVPLDSGDVWNIAAYVQQTGEIQGFGVRDSANELLFAFAGTEEVDPATWVTVYQGAFPTDTWNDYRLPLADAWLAQYGYLPVVTGLVFINDRDADPTSVILFDDIEDITSDLPSPPAVSITWTLGTAYRSGAGLLSVDVEFQSHITDPDTGGHTLFWRFGDGSTSSETHPQHTFLVQDDHAYRVLLEATDATDLCGRASCVIAVDPGPTSFPLSMNFIGDVMLARNYEAPGGIIPTRGVEAIFAPTLSILGEAADITVANLECPLTQSGTPHPTKPIVFRGSPANAAGLSFAGIDVVTLANNHIVDYGLAGLQETQNTLRQRSIAFSGAGGNSTEAYEPVLLSKSGLTFGFLAFSDRTGQYNNYQPYLDAGENKPGFANLTAYELTRRVAALRPDTDILVVEMHSGAEYSTAPSLGMNAEEEDEGYSAFSRAPTETNREIRRLALEAGADLVVCHHPHITHGFEVSGGKLIAHSLGNFAFDLSYTETFPSMVLQARVEAAGITGYTVTPVYIDDYIPLRAGGELGLYILDDLAMKSRALGTVLVVDRSAVTATILLDTLALTPRTVNRTVSLPLHQSGGMWVSQPFRLPRSGSLQSVAVAGTPGAWSVRAGREVLWMGNFEDEGCSLWELETTDETPDTGATHGGHRSLRQRRSAGAGSLITSLEKRLKTGGGLQYSLCCWIKSSNSSETGVDLLLYDTRTGFSEIGSGNLGDDVVGTTDWTFYAADLAAPAGTAFLDVELRSSGPVAGTGYSWFDDVSVVEWSGWSPAGETLPTPNDYYWMQVRSGSAAATASVTYVEQQFVDTHAPAQVLIPVTPGWNMVSNPVTLPDSLTHLHSLFPHSTSAFAFSPGAGYVPAPTLPSGPGFWARFPAGETVTITGTPLLDDTVAVVGGWNMIGSLSTPAETSSMRSMPDGLIASAVYGYGAGYSPTAQLLPGSAYWVKCRDSGTVILSGLPGRPGTGTSGRRTTPDILLTVSDASGRSQVLQVGTGQEISSRFAMPPPAPGGTFDARFAPGQYAVSAETESTVVHPIAVSGAVYPLTVTWSASEGAVKAELIWGTRTIPLDGAGSAQVPQHSGGVSIRVLGRLAPDPAGFALEQNYPNPFNPTTVIRYALPLKGPVSLGIYSVTGQLIRTLVSGEQLPGRHSVAWDGRNNRGEQVGSGVYFSRLVAGHAQFTRKLLLLR